MAECWVNPIITDIVYGGSKGSGKSFGGINLIFGDAFLYPETHYFIARKKLNDIRKFTIPVQEGLSGEIFSLTSVSLLNAKRKVVKKNVRVELRKKGHLLLAGPNGIGKSTLLEAIANGTAEGSKIADGVRVGYYRQDF